MPVRNVEIERVAENLKPDELKTAAAPIDLASVVRDLKSQLDTSLRAIRPQGEKSRTLWIWAAIAFVAVLAVHR